MASSTLEADEYTDIDTFIFSGQSATGGRLNVRGVTEDDLFIFESDAGRNDEFIRFEANSVGQSLTFEMRATAEDDGQIEFVANGNGNSASAIGFTGNNSFDEVTIHSTGMNEDANLIHSIGTNGNFYAFNNTDGPTNFNITGGQDLTITAAKGVELNRSDDERGFAESVNLDGSGATGDLRIAGSAVNDAIEGGSGDDILYGLGGDDILTGNDGADQFRFTNWSGTDEIIDFVSDEDVIGLNRIDF
ncbi:calcium-binding protein, partial [uncultured Maritalea sp.]|uniref:calcium-binding protein n=1 Tax=uncultured Maritalea sp. TaxID=757249 RepID=UPI00345CB458